MAAKTAAPPDKGRRTPKVLHLCAVDFTVKQFIAPLALHLARQGLKVQVACSPGPYWKELKEKRGLDMVPLRIARSVFSPRHPFSLLRLWWLLVRGKYDVLHVHTPVASMIGRLAGWLARVPVIIYTAHGFYFHDRMKPSKYRFHVGLERFFSLFQDELFCVSEEDARSAERYRFAPAGRIHVVRNGVDESRFNSYRHRIWREDVRRELGIPEDAVVVTIMGRVTREKGFLEFFEAAKLLRQRFPKVHFLAVGDTLASDRDRIGQRLAELAKSPELAGVLHQTGMRDDVPQLLAASDVFCLPSHREGLPVSIMEAMMMGLPVVATRIRGCREEVVDGSTGFLVEVGKVQELADAIGYLVARPELMQKMGLAGQRRAEELYSLGENLRNQWRLYRMILADHLKWLPDPNSPAGKS